MLVCFPVSKTRRSGVRGDRSLVWGWSHCGSPSCKTRMVVTPLLRRPGDRRVAGAWCLPGPAPRAPAPSWSVQDGPSPHAAQAWCWRPRAVPSTHGGGTAACSRGDPAWRLVGRRQWTWVSSLGRLPPLLPDRLAGKNCVVDFCFSLKEKSAQMPRIEATRSFFP